jgi:hypothetical protein
MHLQQKYTTAYSYATLRQVHYIVTFDFAA